MLPGKLNAADILACMIKSRPASHRVPRRSAGARVLSGNLDGMADQTLRTCTVPIAIVTAAWVGSITGTPSASSSGRR